MPLSSLTAEIGRLTRAFALEAEKFHDTRLTNFFVSQGGANIDRPFLSPNHTIMLWQYYGAIEFAKDRIQLVSNLADSELNWGVRGAQLSSFALIEGHAYDLFVRMGMRAGSLFDTTESQTISHKVTGEIIERERLANPTAKPTAVTNGNPLAVWINFLLYHLSLTHPGREKSQRIEPDPFTLSLLALERLAIDQNIGKVDRSRKNIQDLKFEVAMSFPGEHRAYAAAVVDALRPTLGEDEIFYDFDYQAQLARPNLDTLLQDIYRNRCRLVVVFLCAEYAQKQWCGLEWRAIRDIIKSRQDDKLMFVRLDDAAVDGLFSIDGFIDARTHSPAQLAQLIAQRLGSMF